jgi:arginase
MGPSAIRIADLEKKLEDLGHKVTDYGDLDVMIPETQKVGTGKLRYKKPILAACRELMKATEKCLDEGRMPLVLGGDHSIAIGSVAGSTNWFARRGEHLGLIWFDAHGDANTPETTPSGNIHGMSLACLTGHGHADLTGFAGRVPAVNPAYVALVGVRDLDPGERQALRDSGVRCFTMQDIDRRGFSAVMEDAVRIASQAVDGFHVSFDLDVIDPREAPGVGTPVPNSSPSRAEWSALTWSRTIQSLMIATKRRCWVSS